MSSLDAEKEAGPIATGMKTDAAFQAAQLTHLADLL